MTAKIACINPKDNARVLTNGLIPNLAHQNRFKAISSHIKAVLYLSVFIAKYYIETGP